MKLGLLGGDRHTLILALEEGSYLASRESPHERFGGDGFVNEPVMHKPTWTVWTHDAIYQTYPSGPMSALWCWSAHGPRGSQSGAEPTADAAAMKAQCAMLVLSNDGPKKVGA